MNCYRHWLIMWWTLTRSWLCLLAHEGWRLGHVGGSNLGGGDLGTPHSHGLASSWGPCGHGLLDGGRAWRRDGLTHKQPASFRLYTQNVPLQYNWSRMAATFI